MERRDAEGFTLLEVMIALSILALVLTAVLRLHGQSLSLLERSSTEIVAPFLAEKVLSGVILELPEPLSREGSFDDFPGWRWEAAVTPVEGGEEAVSKEAGGGLFHIRVRLFKGDLAVFILETLHGGLP